MPLFQSGVADEGRHADEFAVGESPEIEAARRQIADAFRGLRDRRRAVLFDRLSERERFTLEGFSTELPPSRGVGFEQRAYFQEFVPPPRRRAKKPRREPRPFVS